MNLLLQFWLMFADPHQRTGEACRYETSRVCAHNEVYQCVGGAWHPVGRRHCP